MFLQQPKNTKSQNLKSKALIISVLLFVGSVLFFFGGKLIFAQAVETASHSPTTSPFPSPTPTASPSPRVHGEQGKQEDQDDNDNGRHENDDQEEQDIEQMENDEGDIHQNLNNAQEQLKKIRLPNVEISQLNTYGDAIKVLKALQGVIEDVKKTSATQDQITGSLSEQEKLLFNKLFNKHHVGFSVLDARVREVGGQIQELINLLTPMTDKTMPDNFGLKQLVLLELKGFREQVNDLTDNLDLDFEEIDAETF